MSSGWGWGSLFGGNAAKSKDAPKNAILGLRSTLEMLAKREKHLQNQMDEQDAIARKNVNTNKGGRLAPDHPHSSGTVRRGKTDTNGHDV
jgi:hypothetical protein